MVDNSIISAWYSLKTVAITMISLIVALTETYLIGKDNQLIWHLPDDLKRFKALTLNKPVIMGRQTFDSIGKPLPKRRNIVLTRDENWSAPDVDVAHSVTDALAIAEQADPSPEEIMVIGGAQIYKLFAEHADRLYCTWVDYTGDGDTYFPDIDWSQWKATTEETHPRDDKHELEFRFVDYQRI